VRISKARRATTVAARGTRNQGGDLAWTRMDFDEVIATLDSAVGKFTIVYPALDDEHRDEPDPALRPAGSLHGEF
jgi:hypothetical protein